MAGTYCTSAELKAWLQITGSGDDTILDNCGMAAESLVQNKLGCLVIAASATRYFHAVDDVRANGADLVIGYHTSITSVTNGDGTTVSSGNYQRLPLNGNYKNRLHLKGSSGLVWTYSLDPVGAITIVANWGLVAASANVPPDIEQLTLELASWLYRGRDTAQAAEILAVVRGGVLARPAKLPPYLQTQLNALQGVF